MRRPKKHASLSLGIFSLIVLSELIGGGNYVRTNRIYATVSPIPDNQQVLLVSPKPVYFGEASWYSNEYCQRFNQECLTASGRPFDDTARTAACSSAFKLGSWLKVSYKGKTIEVKCSDRGSFEKKYPGRILDLSLGAFKALENPEKGIIQVKIEVK